MQNGMVHEIVIKRRAIRERLSEIDKIEGPLDEELVAEITRLEIDLAGYDFDYFRALQEDPFRGSVVAVESPRDETICPRCRQEMNLINSDDFLVCERCYVSRPAPFGTENSDYSDDKPKHSPPYRKITYFDTWIEYLESSNWVNIPPQVINDIRMEERNLVSGDLKTIPPIKIRDWLSKHKHSQYYKNVPQIYSIVTGLPRVQLSRETKMLARKHFLDGQEVWRKNFDKERNMSGYATIVANILASIGFPQYAAYFPKIKHDDLNRNATKRWDFIAGKIGLSDQQVPRPTLVYYNKQKKPSARKPRTRKGPHH